MSLQASSTITRLDLGLSVDEFDARADRDGFIGHRVLPIVQRTKPTGDYAKRTLESILQNHSTTRTAGGEYPRSSSKWTTDSYSTTERAHEATLDDRTTRKYDDIVDAEFWETERLIDIILRSYEVDAAAAVFNATTWTGAALTTAVGIEWSTSATAVPITNVDAARELIVSGFGAEPNALIINRLVFRNLRNVTQIIDRVKYQNFMDVVPGRITASQMAAVFDLDFVLVAGGIQNTANENVARSISRIWGNEYAMLCKISTTGNPSEAAIGKTVMWSEEGATDGERPGVIIEQYREESRRGDAIRARTDDQLKIDFAVSGHLLSNITA